MLLFCLVVSPLLFETSWIKSSLRTRTKTRFSSLTLDRRQNAKSKYNVPFVNQIVYVFIYTKMNCVIPGPNLKIFGKAIHALAKVGDDLYFDANEKFLAIKTVNISTTVFGVVKYFMPFFTHYKLLDDSQVTDSQKGICCKLPIKAFLGVFKYPIQMEKQVEICQIEIEKKPTKILLKFRYKNQTTKTQYIWLLDGDESLEITELGDKNLNKIVASSGLYNQALANFQTSDGEVSFEVNPGQIILRNYVVGEAVNLQHVRSQLTLNPQEFTLYKIVNNCTITYSLRHFKAAVQFAEYFNLNVNIHFQTSGKPVEITTTNNTTFESKFVLASLSDSETQTTAVSSRPETNQTQNINNNKDTELSWDNFDSEELKKVFKPKEKSKINELNIINTEESPISKKIRFIFQRCFETTYNGSNLDADEEIFAENSDPECEELLK